jgi:tetratricopeptide (TPR) repeat protein
MSRRGGKRRNPARSTRPDTSRIAENLDRALALHRAGSLARALGLYTDAAYAMPGNHRLWLAVASVALDLGDLNRARKALIRAAVLQPGDTVAWVNLTSIGLRGENKAAAEADARRALAISPSNLTALNNLARSLTGAERPTEFDHASKRAAIAQPNDPVALMGRVLWSSEVDQPSATIVAARRGLSTLPGDRTFLSNLGAAHAKLEDRPSALLAYRRALLVGPDFVPAWYNLGNLHDRNADSDKAIKAHDRAVLLAPENADYQFNRALAVLLAGRFTDGFSAFEHRWRSAAQTTEWREPGCAPWNGQPLNGETVMVWAEQGLGDTIQFSRYLRFIRDRGGIPLIEVQPELAPLLRHSPLPETVYPREQEFLPVADFHVPMLSLPRLAASTPNSVPPPIPFHDLPLFPIADTGDHSLEVGLVWAGNPKHHRDRERSIPLDAFAPIAKLAGVRLHVIQHGGARDQIETCVFRDRLILHPETADFVEAASLISAMDLVITVDTAHAHLAGTLGVETWVLISQAPDWRWLLHRPDSIWYPSVRLYRQDESRSWPSVISRITGDLSKRRT